MNDTSSHMDVNRDVDEIKTMTVREGWGILKGSLDEYDIRSLLFFHAGKNEMFFSYIPENPFRQNILWQFINRLVLCLIEVMGGSAKNSVEYK